MSERQQPDLSTQAGTSYRGGGTRRSEKKSAGIGRTIGMNMVMAVLIAGLVLAGWFIANQQEMLAQERARGEQAHERLAKLENRLSATDNAMAQDGQDTSQKIGLWETEIRKLWAVSNDRNKKWIKANESGVSKLQNSLVGLETSNRDLAAAVGRHESAFDRQQALIDQLTSLELQMQQIVRGQRDLVDKVNGATQAVSSLRANIVGKVDDNSEAIQSIDAFRVALNSRLSDMERRLSAVAGASGQ
ncbi:MAG: hypothetical protein GXP16_07955 [Gammaproteobacteria bacterium]|nr:hypothetical protein [Gammaproteobacteria bacterium]